MVTAAIKLKRLLLLGRKAVTNLDSILKETLHINRIKDQANIVSLNRYKKGPTKSNTAS